MTHRKAAGQTAAAGNSRPNNCSLAPLIELRNNGFMPKAGLFWLGLGFRPPKRNALALDPERLPTDEECRSVAGLDVLVLFSGYATKYGILRRLCGSLLKAMPRRLQLIDQDRKRIIFLKLGGE